MQGKKEKAPPQTRPWALLSRGRALIWRGPDLRTPIPYGVRDSGPVGRRVNGASGSKIRPSLFVAGARETSCFGGPKSTFRDRCKGSEQITLKCTFRGRCSTLDMVVIVEELRFRDRCSESGLLDMWLVRRCRGRCSTLDMVVIFEVL